MIYVTGDSNARIFTGKETWEIIPGSPLQEMEQAEGFPFFTVFKLGAATAWRVIDSGSTTKSKEKIDAILATIPAQSRIILVFGELDCTIYLPHYQTTRECVERYFQKIQEVKDRGFLPIVWAAIPGKNPEIRQEFNLYLESKCLYQGLPFLSINEYTTREDGTLKDEYNVGDGHYNVTVLPFILAKLAALIQQ